MKKFAIIMVSISQTMGDKEFNDFLRKLERQTSTKDFDTFIDEFWGAIIAHGGVNNDKTSFNH